MSSSPPRAKVPLHPERAAETFALAEKLRVNALAQARTASDLCIALAIERVRLQCEETESFDIRRLRACMAAHAQAWRDPVEGLEKAASKGELDFPSTFGQGRASPALRSACRGVLAEIAAARASLPSMLEAAELGSSLAASAPPATRPSAL